MNRSSQSVFGYLRVSTSRQVNEGSSIDAQKHQIAEYALRKQFVRNREEIKFFDDAGVSAFKSRTSKRLGWKKMMLECKESRNSIVIATKIDRVFRSVNDCAITLDYLKKDGKNVDLHFCDRGSITNADASEGLTFEILTSIAGFESKLKSSRIKEVKDYMKDNLMHIGGRRKRGFQVQTIDNKKFIVVDLIEKQMLLKIKKYKEKRDDEMKQTGLTKLIRKGKDTDNGLGLASIKEALEKFRRKKLYSMSINAEEKIKKLDKVNAKEISLSTTEKDDLIVEVEKLENKIKSFSISTLHKLLGNDEKINVNARLEQIKKSERNIKIQEDKFIILKKKSNVVSGESVKQTFEKGDREEKRRISQMTLGFRGKKTNAVSTRRKRQKLKDIDEKHFVKVDSSDFVDKTKQEKLDEFEREQKRNVLKLKIAEAIRLGIVKEDEVVVLNKDETDIERKSDGNTWEKIKKDEEVVRKKDGSLQRNVFEQLVIKKKS